MKVQESPLAAVPAATARVAQGSGQADQLEQKRVQDKVTVPAPQEAAAVEQARAAATSARSVRVQEIANAVKSGQYYPSPQQIAQRLVSEAEVEARMRALLAK